MSVSVAFRRDRSAAMLADRFFFLRASPVPFPLSLAPSEVLVRILQLLREPETSIGLLEPYCRSTASSRQDQLPARGMLLKSPAVVAGFEQVDPAPRPQPHRFSASANQPTLSSVQDDPALRHCRDPDTGLVSNHVVHSSPAVPVPASRCPDRRLKLEHRQRRSSCQSTFLPVPRLPFFRLLVFAHRALAAFRAISCRFFGDNCFIFALADFRPSAEKYSDNFLSITCPLYHAPPLSIKTLCPAESPHILPRVLLIPLFPDFITSSAGTRFKPSHRIIRVRSVHGRS